VAFIQRIHPAGDDRCEPGHGNCAVIDCITTEPVTDHETGEVIHPAGTVVWHSHMDAAICPEHRLNQDHPSEDHRGDTPVPAAVTEPCGDCRTHPAAQGHFGL
jgi:hypothetical protein